LKRFRSARDPDFAAALLLYVRNTPAPVRTDTNEITHWLENFTRQFGDPFYVFGFYRDDQLVGFAEAAYLTEERLVVFDYLVIDELNRRNNVFFEFVDHLKRYIETEHPEYRYGLVEACYGPGQTVPSQESALLTRLLKVQGFRVIRAPYYQPRMTLEDAESEMHGDLLIWSTTPIETIKTETYLRFVRAIYYKYYLPWQSIIPADEADYQRHLRNLYERIEREIGRRKTILVNGHKMLLRTETRKPIMTVHRIVSFAAQALIVVVLLTASLLGLKLTFHLSNTTFATIYGLAIASFITVAAIVSREAREIFFELSSLTRFLWRPKTQGLKGAARRAQVGESRNRKASRTAQPPEESADTD
jgi:hypothetical protein